MSRQFQSLVIILILFFCTIYSSEDTTLSVDTTLVILIDLTGDKKDDTIFCHIEGESWEKALSVNYKIVSNNATIFSKNTSDNDIEQYFGNPNLMDWCEGLVPCKKEWYLKRLPKKIIKIFKVKDKKRTKLLDTTSSMSLAYTAKNEYIKSLGLSKEKASVEMKKLISFLKDKDIVFFIIPVKPVVQTYPVFYDPVHKIFIQVYGY